MKISEDLNFLKQRRPVELGVGIGQWHFSPSVLWEGNCVWNHFTSSHLGNKIWPHILAILQVQDLSVRSGQGWICPSQCSFGCLLLSLPLFAFQMLQLFSYKLVCSLFLGGQWPHWNSLEMLHIFIIFQLPVSGLNSVSTFSHIPTGAWLSLIMLWNVWEYIPPCAFGPIKAIRGCLWLPPTPVLISPTHT